MGARKSVLAGSWYPDTAAGCEKEIEAFIQDAADWDLPGRPLVGGVVPHAGWFFSGSIACNVIRYQAHETPPDVLVVFGMHLHAGSPSYIMAEGEWETPFGNLSVEKELAGELIRQFDFTIETPYKCTPENTIELQLPFIKYFFNDVKIVPIGVPPTENSLAIGKKAADIARRLGQNLKVIGSTDLTHYGSNYGFAPKGAGRDAFSWVRDQNDKQVIDAMLEMEPTRVLNEAAAHQNACCAGAAAAAIASARELGSIRAKTLAYANSYDKNPGSSFVGYVGIVFEC